MELLKEIFKSPTSFDSLGNYMGEIPESNLLFVYCQNRDSDCLTRSNFSTILDRLGGESESVKVLRFGHWACGWIEYIAVMNYTPAHAESELISNELEEYPVHDEEHFCNLRYEESEKYWQSLSIAEKVDLCREHGVSIFAARHEYIPDNDGSLEEYLYFS